MPQTLREQLDANAADAEAGAKIDPTAHNGGDWWQLSDAEEEVFGISRDRWPRMMNTIYCYEAFKGIADSPNWDDALIEQARRLRPGWCNTMPSSDEFEHFAKALGGLTSREAHAVYTKQQFWNIRLGLIRYADESPTF